MPKKSAVLPEEAVEILIRYPELLKKTEFPPSGENVWNTLSRECEGKWKAYSWWVNVTKNRNKILTDAREKLGIEVSPTTPEMPPQEPSLNETDLDVTNDDTHSDAGDSELGEGEDVFQLILSPDDWNKIKPVASTTKRTTHTLRPRVYANLIARKFHEEYRMPCAFAFRRGDVYTSENRKCFVKITGYCIDQKKCGNLFRAKAVHEPCPITGTLILAVKTRDTQFEDHAPVKRPLNGAYRIDVGKAALAQGCYNTRNRMVEENTKRGETVGPNIPSRDVVRHAKHDYVHQQLDLPKKVTNPVHVLEELQYQKEYFGSILHLASNPFVIIYATQEQICTYKQYCRVNRGTSVISIDSTGSVVRKLSRPMGLKSAHVFLYSIVINFDHTILSVFQMLSESQEWEMVALMLGAFLRRVNIKPKRCISDKSRTLLLAECIMFNGCSINEYCEKIFEAVESNSLMSKTVNTFLFIDVAHFIHAACKWKCFCNLPHPDIQEFYICCIGLMIDCQTLDDFRRIFFLTCVAAFQKYFDSHIDSSEASTVQECIKILENLIKKRPVDENGFFNFDEMHKLEDCNVNITSSGDSDCPRIRNFIDDVIFKAQAVTSEGTSKSGCYLPALIGDLRRIGMEFVLWTAVGNPLYMGHQSSSCSEANFKIIKNDVFREYSLPQRADKFVVIDIKSSVGRTRDFESNLKNFIIQKQTVPEPLTKQFNEKKPQTEEDNIGNNPQKAREDRKEDLRKEKAEQKYTFDDFGEEMDTGEVILENIPDDDDFNSRENWRGKASRFYFSAADSGKGKKRTTEISDEDKCRTKREKNQENFRPNSEVQGKCENNCSQNESDGLFQNSQMDINISGKDIPLFTSSEIEVILPENCDTDLFDTGTVIDSTTLDTGNEEFGHELTPKDFKNMLIEHDYLAVPPIKESLPFKRSTGKSFRPRPELTISNFSARRGKATVHLLPNGNRPKCPTPTIDGKPYIVRNTCPLDSVVQVLYSSALDDESYCSFLKKSTSPLSDFVIKFLEKGPCKTIYEDRAKLLRGLFPSENTDGGNLQVVYTINAWGNPIYIWSNLMKNDPSIFKQIFCSKCGQSPKEYKTWSLNVYQINRFGYQNAQGALQYHKELFDVKCTCGGSSYQVCNSNHHVYLELDVRTTNNSPPKTCKLRDLPPVLMFSVDYRLAGIICVDSGHFKAYCRRLSGHWELHDGLKDKVEPVRNNPTVTPECAIYIIQNRS